MRRERLDSPVLLKPLGLVVKKGGADFGGLGSGQDELPATTDCQSGLRRIQYGSSV
jgi:hypothetical protein